MIVFLSKSTIASLCLTVQRAFPKIVADKLSKLDSKLSDIWNYFRTMSDGRRQTESLFWVTFCSNRNTLTFDSNSYKKTNLSGVKIVVIVSPLPLVDAHTKIYPKY